MLIEILTFDWTKAIFSNHHQEKLNRTILIPFKELESAYVLSDLLKMFSLISSKKIIRSKIIPENVLSFAKKSKGFVFKK